MKNYLDQHRKLQDRKLHPVLKRLLIIHIPIGFILIFIIIPGWIARQSWHLPMGIHPTLGYIIGGLIFLLGFSIYLWTIILFAKAKGTQVPFAPTQQVVTTGPYSLSRNPMATSGLFMVVGLGIILNSWSFILAGSIPFCIYLVYIRFVEEKELENRFGEDYRAYRKNTPFLIPALFVKR